MEVSFQQNFFLSLYTMTLVSCGCVDEVVDNQANYEGYKYVYFLHYHTLTGVKFMIGEKVTLSEELFLMYTFF